MTLQQLVIQNLAVLEQAPVVAEEVDDKVMRAIDRRVENWASSRPEWWVDADYDKDLCHFGPESWPHDPDDRKAYYYLGSTSEKDDEDYLYYVSALTGAVPIEFGIWFEVDAPWLTRRTGRGARPRAAWQEFLAAQLVGRQRLQSSGFRLLRGGLFLPVRLSADDLANAYPDALDDALAPLDDALIKLEETHFEIDTIVKAATSKFSPP
jgi:hypothetical protein